MSWVRLTFLVFLSAINTTEPRPLFLPLNSYSIKVKTWAKSNGCTHEIGIEDDEQEQKNTGRGILRFASNKLQLAFFAGVH